MGGLCYCPMLVDFQTLASRTLTIYREVPGLVWVGLVWDVLLCVAVLCRVDSFVFYVLVFGLLCGSHSCNRQRCVVEIGGTDR